MTGTEWAKYIKRARHDLGLTQAQLGRELHMDAMTVSRWERGAGEPPESVQFLIREFLDRRLTKPKRRR